MASTWVQAGGDFVLLLTVCPGRIKADEAAVTSVRDMIPNFLLRNLTMGNAEGMLTSFLSIRSVSP